jgi:hypothetical protein
MVTTNALQRGSRLRSVASWVGLGVLALGAAAFAGASGISRYRTQAIIDNPCLKNALSASALERLLTASAAVLLIAAAVAFAAVLVSAIRHRTGDAARGHAWAGFAVAVVLLLPVTNLVAGDPLGFDAQMLPNCATMASLGGAS